MPAGLKVSRARILSYRRAVNGLDRRLPAGSDSLRQAAWAGLQDSMPRAALLSIHARVEGTQPDALSNADLVQLWGPRYSVYVVTREDLALFSLGRLPHDAKRRARAVATAEELSRFLGERRMPLGVAGRGLRTDPNMLRYAAPTGTVLIRWDGARQPDVWCVPRLSTSREAARLDLARRFLRIFGPTTDASFARWAGIRPAEAEAAFGALGPELVPVTTPLGEAWVLEPDLDLLRASGAHPVASARLLPSGDAYFLAWGADRELLVPQAEQRSALWTSRVWPGALLVNGELVGVWRRAGSAFTLQPWQRLANADRGRLEAEVESMPLPDAGNGRSIRWMM